jgi:hypothetical protein
MLKQRRKAGCWWLRERLVDSRNGRKRARPSCRDADLANEASACGGSLDRHHSHDTQTIPSFLLPRCLCPPVVWPSLTLLDIRSPIRTPFNLERSFLNDEFERTDPTLTRTIPIEGPSRSSASRKRRWAGIAQRGVGAA